MCRATLTASMVAPNVIVLNIKNATQYPNRGEEDADEEVICIGRFLSLDGGRRQVNSSSFLFVGGQKAGKKALR